MPVPDAIRNAPELHLDEQLYFTGYLDLNSCRPIGMGEGPIPWSAMMEYCMVHGIAGELLDDFMYIIRHLDNEIQAYKAAKREAETPKQGARRPPSPRRG